jgi:HK97 family phage prohead protease
MQISSNGRDERPCVCAMSPVRGEMCPMPTRRPFRLGNSFRSLPGVQRILPGVANDLSGQRDVLLQVNHSSIAPPLARESSKTMTLKDTPSALTFDADLDPENSLARDLASSIGRGNLTQMSIGFRVLDDAWSTDYMERTVSAIELFEISAVSRPASASTSISLVPPETAAKKKLDDEFGGPDGTQNAPYPYGSTMMGDGTGSRDKSRWSSAERRAGARAGGVEQRANLRGSLEVRAFTVWAPSPAVVPVVAPVRKRNDALKLELDLFKLRRHGLQLRKVAKYTEAQKQAMLNTGNAMVSPATGKASFPIKDHEDVKNAVKAVGLGAADDGDIRKHIIKNAAKIGASHLIPRSWNADGSLK